MDLQVELLAEHHGTSVAQAEELPERERDVTPEKVLDAIDAAEDRAA